MNDDLICQHELAFTGIALTSHPEQLEMKCLKCGSLSYLRRELSEREKIKVAEIMLERAAQSKGGQIMGEQRVKPYAEDGDISFDAKKGIVIIVNRAQKKAWRFRLPEFDYEEALEELSTEKCST
jgi:hypothetical protein